jgi:hypothetical protein
MEKVSNIRSALLVKSIFAALYVFNTLLTSTEACVSIVSFKSSLYSRCAPYTIECSQHIGDIFHLSCCFKLLRRTRPMWQHRFVVTLNRGSLNFTYVTDNVHSSESFFKTNLFNSWLRNQPHRTEPENVLQRSAKPPLAATLIQMKPVPATSF